LSARITVEKKEFENFIAENQKLVDRSQGMMTTIAKLEKENMQLRQELEESKIKLRSYESSDSHIDDSVRKARDDISRLIMEIDKRVKQ